MNKVSAGLLLYRIREGVLELLIAHPGGPYFINKDEGSWTIPKGEVEEGEELQKTAIKEFEEETGIKIEEKQRLISLGNIKLKSGKEVHAWALEKDWGGEIKSNDFEMEWPPKSGKIRSFPEIDKAGYYNEEEAKKKLNPAQAEFIERLREKVSV